MQPVGVALAVDVGSVQGILQMSVYLVFVRDKVVLSMIGYEGSYLPILFCDDAF